MEIRYPNYYKKFHCIAGDCPDTCCAGWEIHVDAASEKRYRAAVKKGEIQNKEFARKLKKHIKHGRIISEDVTCPFLNRDGLCEMYMELGPDSLCHTCARHPRHREDYGNLQEMVLLLSCPEAARLILEENDGGFYVRKNPKRHGNLDGIDEEFLGFLLQMRECIWTITKEESMPFNRRLAYTLALGHDVQRRIQRGKCDEIPNVLERYTRSDAEKRFFVQWKQEKDTEGIGDAWIADLLDEFAALDPVYRDWEKLMEIGRVQICGMGSETNCMNKKTYDAIPEEPAANSETQWSSIYQYYIYSFLLSALYDDDVLSKIKMAVCCTILTIQLFHACRYQDAERELADLCHAVARQIENSDINRQTLERVMRKEAFSSRRIIGALLE